MGRAVKIGSSILQQQVAEFHRVYGHPIVETPTVPSSERVRFRIRFIMEEAFEAMEAVFGKGSFVDAIRDDVNRLVDSSPIRISLPELADAFADLDYVIEGARLEFGIDGAPIAEEVHRSNMSKLGVDGKPMTRADGKTLKGPNFSPPDIAGELRKQGWKP
jgi:predicted HAD superfamily Cof-like phosphohydrolase